jgi:amidase
MTDWQRRCAERKQVQLDAIPTEWIIQCPTNDQLNVMDVPAQCGLLSAREMEITDTVDVEVILQKLHNAEWSSFEVTTAFYKRAIVAQQLVGSMSRSQDWLITLTIDQLPDRDLRREGFGSQ